jgi:hypothetical protein
VTDGALRDWAGAALVLAKELRAPEGVGAACARFDELQKNENPRAGTRRCAFQISEDGPPWRCKSAEEFGGPAEIRRRRIGVLANARPTADAAAADAADSEARAQRAEISASDQGVLARAAAGTNEDCRLFLRSASAAPLKRVVAEAERFASAVTRRDARAFLKLIACEVDPLGGTPKRCRFRALTEESQLGAQDAGCVGSFRAQHPFFRCSTKALGASGKTAAGMQGLHTRGERLMNLRCSPARGRGCQPGALPSQICWAVPSGRRTLCTAAPDASYAGLTKLLRHRQDGAARPWERHSQIEVGHPAVLFLQPMNCVPYFRSARTGNVFTAMAAEPCGTLGRALSALLINLALEKSSELVLPCLRHGVCTGAIAAPGADIALSRCTSASTRRESCWVAWCETAAYDTEAPGRDAFTETRVEELRRFVALMERAELSFAHPSFLIQKGGALYVRPLSLAPVPRGAKSDARELVTDALARVELPPLSEESASEEAATVLREFLDALASILAAAGTDARVLARATAHSTLQPWPESERPPPPFFWISSYLSSLRAGERHIWAEERATRCDLGEGASLWLDPVVRCVQESAAADDHAVELDEHGLAPDPARQHVAHQRAVGPPVSRG